jgi:hypothetical protein
MRALGAILVFGTLIAVGFGCERILYGRSAVGFTDVLGLIIDVLSSLP